MTNKTEAQPEALRLADELVAKVQQTATEVQFDGTLAYSAAELRRLQDENERQRCSIEALAARRNTMSDRIAQLEAELLLATDAAAKGDLARANAGGMELRIAELEAQLAQRQVPADGKWKCGNEYLPFHPSASHVNPDYRDGWNDCYRASPTPPQREPLTDEKLNELYLTTLGPPHARRKSAFDFARAIEAAHGIKGAD